MFEALGVVILVIIFLLIKGYLTKPISVVLDNAKADEVAWQFNGVDYKSKEQFREAFFEYNKDILEKEVEDFLLVNFQSVIVFYMGVPDGEEDYDEDLTVELKTQDKKGFSFVEFLYKFHQSTRSTLNPEIADHIFYEGVMLEPNNSGKVSLRIRQGS